MTKTAELRSAEGLSQLKFARLSKLLHLQPPQRLTERKEEIKPRRNWKKRIVMGLSGWDKIRFTHRTWRSPSAAEFQSVLRWIESGRNSPSSEEV